MKSPALLILITITSAAAPPAASKWQLVFADEFDGSAVDTAKWNFRTGPRHWSEQRAANVSVSGGMLRLTLRKEKAGSLDYTGGGVISK